MRFSLRAMLATLPLPQQRLYFSPEPQAQRELRLGFAGSVGFCRIVSDSTGSRSGTGGNVAARAKEWSHSVSNCIAERVSPPEPANNGDASGSVPERY